MTRYYERNKICTCKNCGNTFEAIRYNAETCSPKCRKAYSRKLASIVIHKAEIEKHLDALNAFRNSDGDPQAYDVVKHLAKRLQYMVDYWS